jgi:glycosidase
MKGRQNKGGASDANDIPVREAFRWTHRVEDPGSAIWYRGTDSWWTDRYARDDDGISVEEERSDPKSLLTFYRRLLALRRARADLREGDQRIVATDQPSVLAVLRTRGRRASLLVANFSALGISARIPSACLPGANAGGAPADLLTNTRSASIEGADIVVNLPPFAVQLLAAR